MDVDHPLSIYEWSRFLMICNDRKITGSDDKQEVLKYWNEINTYGLIEAVFYMPCIKIFCL